jgi:hypothetical protein
MPQMNGPALAERLVARRPNIRVLYMSGYTHEAAGRHGLLAEGTALVQKPFAAGIFAGSGWWVLSLSGLTAAGATLWWTHARARAIPVPPSPEDQS